jgi:molybdenum cofactor cytidylyltransferase
VNSVAAIILAAGASTRLGTPKQLVCLGSERLLNRTVRVALEAGLYPVFGVVAASLKFDPAPIGMISVVNGEAAEGMASSIRAGLRALLECDTAVNGAVFLACDQPAVTADHLRQLAKGGSEITVSAYSGRKGIPAYFPVPSFPRLLDLQGDVGARDLIMEAKAVALFNGELDIDTFQDLELALKLYQP